MVHSPLRVKFLSLRWLQSLYLLFRVQLKSKDWNLKAQQASEMVLHYFILFFKKST